MRVFRIPGGKVRLITEEGVRDPILAYIVISEYTDEVLINDQMISRLGIVIEDPAKGLWRLKNENKISKKCGLGLDHALIR